MSNDLFTYGGSITNAVEILKLSGFPDIQINSKIDFDKLYNERKN